MKNLYIVYIFSLFFILNIENKTVIISESFLSTKQLVSSNFYAKSKVLLKNTQTEKNETYKEQNYFPPQTFSSDPEVEKAVVNWYSKYLTAMNEPSLFCTKEKDEVYRISLFPAFGLPTTFRTKLSDGKEFLIFKQVNVKTIIKKDRDPINIPGKLKINKTINFTETQWKEFMSYIKKMSFWTLSTRSDVIGEDGVIILIEGTNEGKYHVIKRWLPGAEKPIQDFYFYLSKMSGLKSKTERKY